MKRKQQILRAVKLCDYKLNVGYDFGHDYVCAVLTMWARGYCRVLGYRMIDL